MEIEEIEDVASACLAGTPYHYLGSRSAASSDIHERTPLEAQGLEVKGFRVPPW